MLRTWSEGQGWSSHGLEGNAASKDIDVSISDTKLSILGLDGLQQSARVSETSVAAVVALRLEAHGGTIGTASARRSIVRAGAVPRKAYEHRANITAAAAVSREAVNTRVQRVFIVNDGLDVRADRSVEDLLRSLGGKSSLVQDLQERRGRRAGHNRNRNHENINQKRWIKFSAKWQSVVAVVVVVLCSGGERDDVTHWLAKHLLK